MNPTPPRDLAIIACRVLEAELSHILPTAPRVARTDYFEIGLHDRPDHLRRALTDAIGRVEDDARINSIALVYGVCGLGTVGLGPRRCQLVIPRAHDCLTLFLGNRERYARVMRDAPGTHWYTPGWNQARRVPGPDREAALRKEYTEKFGPEEAEALMEMERDSFSHDCEAGYTDFGLAGNDAEKAYAQRAAAWLGWKFTEHPGDPTLLQALIAGDWDADRFLIVPPGSRIAFSADHGIVRSEPCSGT